MCDKINASVGAAVATLAAALLIAWTFTGGVGGVGGRTSSSPLLHPAAAAAACTLDDERCFDWSLCARRGTAAVYIYTAEDEPWWSRLLVRLFADDEISKRFDRRVAAALSTRDSGVNVSSDPAKACLFVSRVGSCLSVNQCALPLWLAQWRLRALPFWNGTGRNHVLLDHFDSAYASHLPLGHSGLAVSIRSATSTQHFRPGFDVALPLLGKMSAYRQVVAGPGTENAGNISSPFAFDQRKVLVGFLGAPTTPADDESAEHTNKLGIRGLRQLLPSLHAPSSRVNIRVREPKCKVPCKKHAPEFRTEYKKVLLTSRFQVVPRGNGLHSHRLLESLSAGSIPIILADGIVLPFSDIIPWHEAVVVLPEMEWRSIPVVAKQIEADPERARSKQCAGLAIYRNFFLRPGGGSIGLAFRLLQSRVRSNLMLRKGGISEKGSARAGVSAPPSPKRRLHHQQQYRVLVRWPQGKEPAMPEFCKGSKGWTAVESAAQRLTQTTAHLERSESLLHTK